MLYEKYKIEYITYSYLGRSSDHASRLRLKSLVDEYTERVEQTKQGINLKRDEMDLFEWARELAEKRSRHQPPPAEDVDYGARREVGKDGLAHAPLDADLYVRPDPAKKKGPTTKKKDKDVEVDLNDVYGGSLCLI
jgi:hypothetical protein